MVDKVRSSKKAKRAGTNVQTNLDDTADPMRHFSLRHDFVDDSTLFKNYGLSRNEQAHFRRIYSALPRLERPTLSVFFDPKWYLYKYIDVAENTIDPFIHFCSFGLQEGRDPHPLIEVAHIETYLGRKIAAYNEILDIIREEKIPTSPYFEAPLYREKFPIVEPFDSALRHFLSVPEGDVFVPCQFFDATFYTERYHDVPKSPRDAFIHFVSIGDRQSRVPSSQFDPEWYLRTYQDVAEVGIAPLQHFLKLGLSEGRSAVGRQTFTADRRQSKPTNTNFVAEITLEKAQQAYQKVAEEIGERRNARIRSFNEYDALPENCENVLEAIKTLHFPTTTTPKLSILIPVYNELKVTVECLMSIMHSDTSVSFEVCVADDCSPDENVKLLDGIPGLIYLRNKTNMNFLLSSNNAYKKLRGDYILLLNNDAQIRKGSIDRLVSALEDSTVGAVGPKILFPNGRLQEAGCSINLDATANMIGLFQNPNDPSFAYSRDVEYISGAALMVKRIAVGGELFDENLAPAYCEDLDLCLRVRKAGYRVRYVADAEVIHHLSVSMSDHSKKMANITRNQNKIFEKWADTIADSNKVRVISFYLPQFHPIKENDFWWGKGFTEWTNVSKAEPSYTGHYQPHLPSDLGFYDLRVREVFHHQAKLIHRYGLGGICIYYYNFGGERFLGRPLEMILNNSDIDIPFCLCWANENWSKRWDGGTRDLLLDQSYTEETISALARDVSKAAADPRYIKVGGKPVFLIYRPLLIPDPASVVDKIREIGRNEGGVDFHLLFVESLESLESGVSPLDFGFDASVEFPPHGIAIPSEDTPEILKVGWKGKRFDYEKTVVNATNRRSVPWPRYFGTFPSWDNTARQPFAGTSFDNCSPEAFQRYAEEQIRKTRNAFCDDSRLIFVNAWNEWAEGAHLEPDRAYGHRWLEAIRTALEKEGSIT